MCVDHDSRPPIAPIAGAAVDGTPVELTAADGNRFAAYRADASAPTRRRHARAPRRARAGALLRGARAPVRRGGVDAIAIDYYGRTAGASRRDAELRSCAPRRPARHGPASGPTRSPRPSTSARSVACGSLSSVGFCVGGRISFLLATVPEVGLAGAIGFYGWPVGPRRDDLPAPADVAASMRAPVLAIFGGDDQGIPPDHVAAFRSALEGADVEHRIIVMQGAPHSFFDRKQDSFAAASREAWDAVRAFVREHATTEGRAPG